jgi:hypothetical protein
LVEKSGERGEDVRTVAVVFNVILVGFTLLVMATDGTSREAPYVVFACLLLVVPTVSAALLVRMGLHRPDPASEVSPAMRGASQIGALCNLPLLAFACWAIYDQHPHPDETGFLAYVGVVLVTPILSMVTLLAGGRSSVGRDSQAA